MADLIIHGLYKIKDNYFEDFKRPYWVDNKNEQRPYYYLIRDNDGVDWVIPMSSQVENYEQKIKKEEEKRGAGNCLYYQIGEIASIKRVFLIGDMFPIDSSYIKAPYTIGAAHYIVKNDSLNKTIYSKSMRYLKLLSAGKMHSRNNVMGIKRIILNRKKNKEFLI